MRVLLSSAGRRWEEEARVVVCCEGEEGSVARSLGLAGHVPPGDLSSGAQYELVGVEIEDPTVLTCWVGRRVAPGGYAWLFPKGDDRANVGVTVLGAGPGAAFAHLDRFIAARPGLAKGSVLEVNAGTIPVGGPIRRLVADGVMVAGDSARQTNPIHAGGICEALEAGRFAGETAAAAIAAGDWSAKGLASYEERWARGYGRVQARLVRARRAIHALSDPDLDYLVSAVSPRDVVELLSGKGFARAVRIFAGRPSLARAFMA
jgi:digeranylgeranylglycerophospholipid reductase